MRESEFASWIKDVARIRGWLRYHTWLSKHSEAGFPDEVLLRRQRLIFAELKVGKSKPSDAQMMWLGALRRVPGIEVYLWRPEDRDEIEAILS